MTPGQHDQMHTRQSSEPDTSFVPRSFQTMVLTHPPCSSRVAVSVSRASSAGERHTARRSRPAGDRPRDWSVSKRLGARRFLVRPAGLAGVTGADAEEAAPDAEDEAPEEAEAALMEEADGRATNACCQQKLSSDLNT